MTDNTLTILLVAAWVAIGVTASYFVFFRGVKRVTLDVLVSILMIAATGPFALIIFAIVHGDRIVLWEVKPKDDADPSKSRTNKP
jgi:drug/metabolite transporter (DMT)-like permease